MGRHLRVSANRAHRTIDVPCQGVYQEWNLSIAGICKMKSVAFHKSFSSTELPSLPGRVSFRTHCAPSTGTERSIVPIFYPP